jgi:hypothetical protein
LQTWLNQEMAEIRKYYWTNLFCSVNFFPAKIFSGILEKGNLSEQKKIWREKNSLSKKGYPNIISLQI